MSGYLQQLVIIVKPLATKPKDWQQSQWKQVTESYSERVQSISCSLECILSRSILILSADLNLLDVLWLMYGKCVLDVTNFHWLYVFLFQVRQVCLLRTAHTGRCLGKLKFLYPSAVLVFTEYVSILTCIFVTQRFQICTVLPQALHRLFWLFSWVSSVSVGALRDLLEREFDRYFPYFNVFGWLRWGFDC
jgi:hypothetical protein